MPMPRLVQARHNRSIVVGMLLFWLALVAFAVHLLFAEQMTHQKSMFLDEAHAISADLRVKLNSNEVVLAGFAAFLRAVNPGDSSLASQFAATVTQAHPHIYMVEVARQVAPAERAALQSSLRQSWRADFSIKDFADIRPGPAPAPRPLDDAWPVVFMHPASAAVDPIYGVDLQTVDYLAAAMQTACASQKPAASAVFTLFEGQRAYILMQRVHHGTAPHAPAPAPSFFGRTMMALLVIQTDALHPSLHRADHASDLNYRATLLSPDGQSGSLLFEHQQAAPWSLDRAFLPDFELTESIPNASQPVVLEFSRQLRWSKLLGWGNLSILLLFVLTLVLVPWLTALHLRALAIAERQRERATYLATHDTLTALPNRMVLADRFNQLYQNWRRNGTPFALALIDLDGFKNINDQHGHDSGDEVLKVISARFTGALRSLDTITRYGGDEFIALLVNVCNEAEARRIGQKLLDAAAQPIQTAAATVQINCSVGFALCPAHGQSLDALRNAADQAMYSAKQQGGNAVGVQPGVQAASV